MKNNFDNTIDQLKDRIGELEAEAIDLKRAVNSLCKTSGKPAVYTDSEMGAKGFSGLGSVKPAQFYGKAPTSAAREYLDMRGEPVELEEILQALKNGSFDFEAQGWKNEIMHLKNLSISLGKNSQTFHRLPNGMMGLLKWFPNVKTKKAGKEADKANDEQSDDSETEIEPAAQDVDVDEMAVAAEA